MATRPMTAEEVAAWKSSGGKGTPPEVEVAQAQSSGGGIGDFFGGLFKGGFDIFGMLIWGAVILGAAYFFGKTDWGKGLINGVIDMMPKDWKPKVQGFMNMIGIDIDMSETLKAMSNEDTRKTLTDVKVPDAVRDAIAPKNDTDNKIFKKLVDEVAIANTPKGADGKPAVDKEGKAARGSVSIDSFTSVETITYLIEHDPEMAKALAKAALSNQPKAGVEEDATTKKIKANLHEIINGKKFDELLSTTLKDTDGHSYRDHLIEVLSAALPKDSPINASKLNEIIEKGMTPEKQGNLRKLLNDAVDQKDANTLGDDLGAIDPILVGGIALNKGLKTLQSMLPKFG